MPPCLCENLNCTTGLLGFSTRWIWAWSYTVFTLVPRGHFLTSASKLTLNLMVEFLTSKNDGASPNVKSILRTGTTRQLQHCGDVWPAVSTEPRASPLLIRLRSTSRGAQATSRETQDSVDHVIPQTHCGCCTSRKGFSHRMKGFSHWVTRGRFLS